MRLDFSELTPEAVEDWKFHSVTQQLMRQLAQAHAYWSEACARSAAAGDRPNYVAGLGGRTVQIRDIVTALKEAKGKKSE